MVMVYDDGYFHTSKLAKDYSTDMTAYGLRAYWKPDSSGSIPSVQVGYDTASIDDAAAGEAEETDLVGWLVLVGKIYLLMATELVLHLVQDMAATSYKGGGSDPSEDNTVWEAYYTFKVNDGVSITPAIFGGSDVEADGKDVNGAVLLN